MTKRKKSIYTCFGDPEDHFDFLKEAAEHGTIVNWTINPSARPGDTAIFYLIGPLSSFVAKGVVCSTPELNEDDTYSWVGHHLADIEKITLLPTVHHLSDVREALPDWGWLRQPRRSTVVPDEFAESLLRILTVDDIGGRFASDSDIEGVTKEVRRLVSSRSRRLRAKALRESKGVCCVCDRDFTQVLDGRGVRVLQVHHREQLSFSSSPRQTTLDDLAVVCANCHMLLHMNSVEPLETKKLRNLLQADGQL